ncbi:MAG TPA: hypothetical protein VMB50_21425 [Myxococcales bacterium]|nr:hypothetical protein [Myxococcales bacterium]
MKAWPLALALLLTPALAFACPYCAGRGGLTATMGALIAGIVSLPYFIGWAVIRAVKRTSADLEQP